MRLGIIGRGPWGNVYAKTLAGMGIDYVQCGRDWTYDYRRPMSSVDGVIIASSPDSHYSIAHHQIGKGIPVLIEKPIALSGFGSRGLLKVATEKKAIVFCGHTRLYSPLWRSFKASVGEVKSVMAEAGGPCKIDPLWDWGPHLVAMCLDLGFDPLKADIRIQYAPVPLRFVVNGEMEFNDIPENPSPLQVLLSEFMEAIKKGEPNIKDLELGVKVTEALEAMGATVCE